MLEEIEKYRCDYFHKTYLTSSSLLNLISHWHEIGIFLISRSKVIWKINSQFILIKDFKWINVTRAQEMAHITAIKLFGTS